MKFQKIWAIKNVLLNTSLKEFKKNNSEKLIENFIFCEIISSTYLSIYLRANVNLLETNFKPSFDLKYKCTKIINNKHK